MYEPYVKDARDYIKLAERKNGALSLPLSYRYIWGDALKIWKREDPDLKLINLETSITTHEQAWPSKGINYRMNPKNVQILKEAGIDHASLANNHVLDWGRPGLLETIEVLENADVKFSGAGKNLEMAGAPSIFSIGTGRVLVYSYGVPNSGIPPDWAAGKERSGVNYLPQFSKDVLEEIKEEVNKTKKSGDLVIFSVHWRSNWGYDINERTQEFAHRLIDEATVDVIFGHSSHHPLGIEVYNEKLIIYGAGDLFNDYEGISGHEKYRGELTLMYFPEIEMETGRLRALKMWPMEIKNFSLNYAGHEDVEWLQRILNRESATFGTEVTQYKNTLWLEW